MAATQVSAVVRSYQGLYVFPIPIAPGERNVQRPSRTARECTLGGRQGGEDARGPVQPGRPRSESWCSSHTPIRVHRCQLKRGVGLPALLGVLHSHSISLGEHPKHFAPSELFWNSPQSSVPNIGFGFALRSMAISDNHISRTSMPSRTRLKYWARASLC